MRPDRREGRKLSIKGFSVGVTASILFTTSLAPGSQTWRFEWNTVYLSCGLVFVGLECIACIPQLPRQRCVGHQYHPIQHYDRTQFYVKRLPCHTNYELDQERLVQTVLLVGTTST